MLYQRQRQLLALVDALGGAVDDTDFHNLLALHGDEVVPHAAGAYSFTAAADRRHLIDRGLLAAGPGWQLTAEGRAAIGAGDLMLAAFAERTTGLRGDALAAAARELVQREPPVDPPALATIGYEGRSLERYLNELLAAGSTVLCDVRKNAFSHKFGFSKSALAAGCVAVGIRYEHLPELGVASDKRKNLDSQAARDELFAAYKRTTLPAQSAAIAKIMAWIRAGDRVALTCFELLPQQCHRHCVAEALGIAVTNL